MPVFKGILSTSNQTEDSQVFNIPATIKSFSVYNEYTSDAVVIVSIVNDSLTEEIIIFSKSVVTKESYSTSIPVLILPGYYIRINSEKDFHFYFTIE
jgi:nitrogen regulatory protein PII-like uncharacterized protein